MAKQGNKHNKERCQRYKAEGRRELNKQKKQERHKNRTQKMKEKMERREAAGKKYVYSKDKVEQKIKNHIPVDHSRSKHCEVQRWDGIMAMANKYYEEGKKKASKRMDKKKEDDNKEV